MPPATSPGTWASCAAISSRLDSVVLPLATSSTMYENWPLARASRSGFGGCILLPKFFPNDFRSLYHCLQFRKRHVARQVEQAAIRKHVNLFGRQDVQSLANVRGHHVRGLDIAVLY